MNRFTKEMKRQGSERFLKIQSRVFTFHAMAGGIGRELSEVRGAGPGYIETFPGLWRGKKHYGFAILASAALNRKYAMQSTDAFRRVKFIERAFEDLERAKDFGRPQLDLVAAVELQRAA